MDLDEETRRIAEYLIGCLDDGGFMTSAVSEVAAELGVSEAAVEKAMARVQELEPPGIGARNLAESLLIQLRQAGRGDGLAGKVVAEHFEAFKQRQYQEIARALKVTPADIQDAAREIAQLNPRPVRSSRWKTRATSCRIWSWKKVEGQYVVSLSDGSVPRAAREPPSTGRSWNARSAASRMVRTRRRRGRSSPRREVRFVQEKLKSASWLIQTIEQRRRTMIRVMEAIVEAQERLLRARPAGAEAAHAAGRGGADRDARVHRQSRDHEQVRADPARGPPVEVLLLERAGHRVRESVSSKMAMGRIERADRRRRQAGSPSRISASPSCCERRA